MIRLKLPTWMRDEASALVEKQMAMARMLSVRLTDPDANTDYTAKGRVRATDVVAIVQKLDALSKELDTLVGGTPSFAQDTDDYRTAVAFSHYCDRAFAYQAEQKRKA